MSQWTHSRTSSKPCAMYQPWELQTPTDLSSYMLTSMISTWQLSWPKNRPVSYYAAKLDEVSRMGTVPKSDSGHMSGWGVGFGNHNGSKVHSEVPTCCTHNDDNDSSHTSYCCTMDVTDSNSGVEGSVPDVWNGNSTVPTIPSHQEWWIEWTEPSKRDCPTCIRKGSHGRKLFPSCYAI